MSPNVSCDVAAGPPDGATSFNCNMGLEGVPLSFQLTPAHKNRLSGQESASVFLIIQSSVFHIRPAVANRSLPHLIPRTTHPAPWSSLTPLGRPASWTPFLPTTPLTTRPTSQGLLPHITPVIIHPISQTPLPSIIALASWRPLLRTTPSNACPES